MSGGTADITVHEKVGGGKIKEVFRASGGPWGGTAVDNRYILLLIKFLGGATIHRFRTEHTYDFLDMMREFEVAKRRFAPDGRTSFNTRVPTSLNKCCSEQNEGKTISDILQSTNCPYKRQIKLIGDKLSIDSNLIKIQFNTLTDQIVEHIKTITCHPAVRDCRLMLVGGFSESEMVQSVMRKEFQTEELRIIIPKEAGLAVVKGAAIIGHVIKPVTDRVVRYNYGKSVQVDFDEQKHDEKHRRQQEDGSVKAIRIFETFMKKDTLVNEGTVIKDEGYCDPYYDGIYIRIFAASHDVQYVDEEGSEQLCRVHLYENKLSHYVGKRIDLEYKFTFGRTEIGIEIEVKQTNSKFTVSVGMGM